MLTEGQPATAEIESRILAEFEDWMAAQQAAGKPVSAEEAARRIGTTAPVLSAVRRGKYNGDTPAILRLIAQFLADEAKRSGLAGLGAFVSGTRAVQEVWGASQVGIAQRTQVVIIAPAGGGKSSIARALCRSRADTHYVEIREQPADRGHVSLRLCETMINRRGIAELVSYRDASHPRRAVAIFDYLARKPSTVLVIDEAQKLNRGGLEFLRAIHDSGIGEGGGGGVPMIFFGNEDFLRRIGEARGGKRTMMSAQIISRMRPIIHLEEHMLERGGLYTTEDILKIVQNGKLKLVTPQAARWLARLAMAPGDFGRLRLALGVLRQAMSLYAEVVAAKTPLDIDHLIESLKLSLGERLAREIDAAADSELLRRVTA